MDEAQRRVDHVAKVAFHAGNGGTSLSRVHAVTAVGVASFALWSALPFRTRSAAPTRGSALLEFSLLVVPLVLSATTFASDDSPLKLACSLVAPVAMRALWHRSRRKRAPSIRPPRSLDNSPRSSSEAPRPVAASSAVRKASEVGPLLLPSGAEKGPAPLPSPSHIVLSPGSRTPSGSIDAVRVPPIEATILNRSFVTVYRAQAMLMTCICILAVDFPAFPRTQGKTQYEGTSLMDLGVGSFVFSLGLVSALPVLRPLVRSRIHQTPPDKLPPLRFRLRKAAMRSLGVLSLGLVRLVMVKGTAYPEQVAEYGVHWNFFFTLSILPLVGAVADLAWPTLSYLGMASLVLLVHQSLLSAGLQDWVRNATRSNLISMNKEGLVSFPGYIAILLLGLDAGLFVLPPDPYFVDRALRDRDRGEMKLKPKPGKLATVLASWAMIWWTAYALLAGVFRMRPSRQTANALYIVWIAAFNVSVILAYLLVELASNDQAVSASAAPLPTTYLAINRNSLLVFLVANLLTGAVNMSMNTINASDQTALGVVLVYALALVTFAWSMRHRRMRLRV